MTRRSLFVGLLLLGAPSPAPAQNPPPRFEVQLSRPSADANQILDGTLADIDGHLVPHFCAWMTWMRQPFRATLGDGGLPLGDLVESRLDVGAGASLTLFRRATVGMILPFVAYQSGLNTRLVRVAAGRGALGSGFVGDVRFATKGQLIKGESWPSLAVGVDVTAPTGEPGALAGEPGPTIQPQLLASWRLGAHQVVINAGPIIRPEASRVITLSVGHELAYLLGYGFEFGGRREASQYAALVSVAGRVPLTGPFDAAEHYPVEVRGGVRYRVHLAGGILDLVAAVGAGVSPGYGTALPRLTASISYLMVDARTDDDGDGLPNVDDDCPSAAEDMDEFQDEDGCPDDDNDEDGIPDEDDECPNKKEIFNGLDDHDGCPEVEVKDTDGDQLADPVDDCPNAPEDVDGFNDQDGCPDPDNDGDGLLDINDVCPDRSEDHPGPAADGCPEPVVAQRKQFLLNDPIRFRGMKLTPESLPVIERVAEIAKMKKAIHKIVIVVCPGRPGKRARKVAGGRAAVLLDAFVAIGIANNRLKVKPVEWDEQRAGEVYLEIERGR